jgi:tetratricopeptide (TPR) repeat protein
VTPPDEPDDVPSPGAALVPAGPRAGAMVRREPPPELRLARSLEEAGRGTFVHVDGRGQVRSPARYRAISALAYGLSGGVILAATAFYMSVFGPLGAAVGVLFGGAFWLGLSRGRKMTRAATLIQADRLDEAEALCRQTLAGRLVPKRLRAVAHQNLSAILSRRGDFEGALGEVRKAVKLRHSSLRRSVYLDVLAYVEIALLVNLGRVGEARARLDGRGKAPEGNYLKVQHWTVDLYVQFSEGKLAIDEDGLWERSQAALAITGASQLLALCAWGFDQRRDEDMVAHLLEQAVDRAESNMATRVPALWKWVEERRKRTAKPAAE